MYREINTEAGKIMKCIRKKEGRQYIVEEID